MTTPWYGTLTVTEARSNVVQPAPIDQAAVILGCSSSGSGGTLSQLYSNPASLRADWGEGPGVTAAEYLIDEYGIPVALYKLPSTNPGTYDTPVTSAFTGTAIVSTGPTTPLNDYEAYIIFPVGATLGTAGGTYKASLCDGRDLGAVKTQALGTGGLIQILLATGGSSGVEIQLGTSYQGATMASNLYGGGGILNGTTLILTQQGGSPLTLNLSGTGNAASQAAFLAAITAEWPLITGTVAAGKLTLTAAQGTIVVGAGTANTDLGLTAGTYAGTINAGDIIRVLCHAPSGADSDIDAAAQLSSPKGPLVQSTYDFAHVFVAQPMAAADAAHVTTLLNNLKTGAGKICDAVIYARGPTVSTSESESTWLASVAADFAAFNDDRIEIIEGHPTIVVDPITSQIWHRPWAYPYFARMVFKERGTWVASPNDGGFTDPQSGAFLVSLYDSSGNLIGHDEGPSGNVTGLGDAFGQGNRFTCLVRGPTPQTRTATYTTVPWVAWTSGGQIITMPQRRIAQAIERAAMQVSFPQLGGRTFYVTNPTTQVSTLLPNFREAIHAVIFGALTGTPFQDDIENSSDDDPDTGLVQVNPVVTVAQGNLVTIAATLAPKVAGLIVEIDLTYAAK